MTSRLVLNLSNAAAYQEHSTLKSGSKLSQPVFASNSFLGNIGAPLRPSGDGDPSGSREAQSVVGDGEASYSTATAISGNAIQTLTVKTVGQEAA